uniref:Protein MTSS 2-like n=1 Tax=Labrus bergylta TaxID=56723 RepID=A0A3Q3FEM3_9LABR
MLSLMITIKAHVVILFQTFCLSGGTRDIGSALTRMCMRHRSIEAKLKQFSMVFLEGLINPLQEQVEDWKRGVNTLDKDHAKEYKRARQEIKKKSSDTLKLQRKQRKVKVECNLFS